MTHPGLNEPGGKVGIHKAMHQSRLIKAVSCVGLIGWCLSSAPAQADAQVTVAAEVTAELQYENGVGPSSAAPQSDYLFTTIEAGLSLGLGARWAIESVVLVEIFDDPPAGENSVFEDHALFAEELKLAYHGDSWSLQAGKFNTAFGMAWDLGPGIWGVDFAEDYEVAEKIGVAGTKTFGNEETGLHTLYGSVYRADRSPLSNSLLAERGRVRLADGGATNTKDFKSYTLSLTGEDAFGRNGFGYHVAYRSHAHGDADLNAVREEGFVASVFGIIPLAHVEIEPLAEVVYISNAEGSLDDLSYVTLGGTAYYGDHWNTALNVTLRTTHVPGADNVNDHRFQATTGYAWDSGASLDFGYRYSQEDGVNDHTIGFLFAYGFSL